MRWWMLIAIALLLTAPRAVPAQDVQDAQDEDVPDRPLFSHLTRIVEVVEQGADTPLAGITVEAWGVPGGPLVRSTGQDGTARFEGMPRNDVVYVARAPGFVCGWHAPGRWWWAMPEEDADTDGDGVTRMRLVLEKGTTVAGRVLASEDGAPVRDAQIEAYEVAGATDMWTLDGAPLWRAKTDAEGFFRTDQAWPAREVGDATLISAWVTTRCRGRIHETVAIERGDAGSQEPLTLTLRRATTIRGVVRRADGEPVPGAIVRAYPPDHWGFAADQRERRDTQHAHPREMTVHAGPDGAYVLDEAVPGTSYFVIAERTEHREEPWPDEFPVARSRVGTVVAPAAGDASPAALDLVLRDLGALAVRVAQDAGGDAPNVRIDVTPPQGAQPWASDDREDGVLRVSEADPGAWTIRTDAMGWLPRVIEVNVAPGEERSVEVRLERGATITGVVRDDDGEPIRDATIYAYSEDPADPRRDLDGREETHTGGDGRFIVSGLRPGPTKLFVVCGELRSDGPSLVRAPATDVELFLSADAVLRVRVRLPEGVEPPGTVRVTITRHAGPNPGSQTQESVTRTGDAYMVTHVPPGAATVAIEAPGYAPATRRLVVRAGVVNDVPGFPLRVGVSLRGRIVDGDGEPVANARILPWGNEGRAAHSAADGTFELPHLASGLLEIAVSAAGKAERFVTFGVTELRPPVEITLTPGALVRGTVSAAGGGKSYIASLDFLPDLGAAGTTSRWRAQVIDEGFAIRLPPGRYRCETLSPADAPDEPCVIEVAEGDELALDLVRD